MERNKSKISNEFLKRIINQARYLEGDLKNYLIGLGLRKGMTALELGSCTGHHSKEIAKAIYPDNLFSLDFNHDCLLYQKKDLRSLKGNMILIEADASSLPFTETFCDFVYSRFLFQHLSNPVVVLLEIRRVLKKGGTIVVIDTDDKYETFFPEMRSVKKAYSALARLQNLKGGDRFIGRKLFTYLVNAGFRNVGIKVIPTFQCGGRNKGIVETMIIPSFKEEYENIIAAKLMGREDLDLAISQLVKATQNKNSLHMGLIFIAFGKK